VAKTQLIFSIFLSSLDFKVTEILRGEELPTSAKSLNGRIKTIRMNEGNR
jgi:hypothetical protein